MRPPGDPSTNPACTRMALAAAPRCKSNRALPFTFVVAAAQVVHAAAARAQWHSYKRAQDKRLAPEQQVGR